MSNIFISDTRLGTLCIKNVYEFFEGPKLFSVTNEVDGLFIVYWIGDDNDFDKWIILPISKTRLEHLERKRIDISNLLMYQEQKFCFQLNLPYDENTDPVLIILSTDEFKKSIKLPRVGLYISSVMPMSPMGKLGSSIEFSTHEIHVEKTATSTEPLVLKGVSKIFESFNDLYSSIMNSLDVKDIIRPVSARPGSFVLSFQADKMMEIEPLLKELNALILSRGDIISFIQRKKIDVQMLSALFENIIETSSSFELKSNSTDELILIIRKNDAEYYQGALLKMSVQVVGSYQIPQANIIEKLFKIVELKWHNKHLNLLSTGLTDRHILYYIHAAKILGFINSNSSVSALGQQVAESNHDKRLRIAARSFESSHCGWAWITWSQVKNLSELDPSTAEAFLLDKCLSLSNNTIKRRASTLRKWVEILKPSYQEL